MTKHRFSLPQMGNDVFLCYEGMETDLIFNQGMALPGFASYPLLETDTGRATLSAYFEAMINLGKTAGVGVILGSPTWVANRDRGAEIGYSPETLQNRNIEAIELMVHVREQKGDIPTVISANIGPRSDAYAPSERMTPQEAENYHSEQIAVLARTDVDMLSAYTLAYPEEAIGIVRAAQKFDLPVMISFTVETDGRLPTGAELGEAIQTVDDATGGYASYFMINCAHPDHFRHVLSGGTWMNRLKGVVANASRCSHTELDESETLDDGDPTELGEQLVEIHTAFPRITILGGCCGTDMRHIESIVKSLSGV